MTATQRMKTGRVLFISVGIVIGVFGSLLLRPSATGTLAPNPTADQIESGDISEQQASQLRREGYNSIQTVAEVLTLPGEFAELEAAYALAARASSSELQDLVYQAASIAQTGKRYEIVRVMLMRLTEIDPLTALALAEGPLDRPGANYSEAVWRGWASRDFGAALAEAATRTTGQAAIANAFYSALPSLDDPRSGQILQALGEEPSAQTQALDIDRVYAQSLEAAMQQLNFLNGDHKTVAVERLASLMVADYGTDAIDYLDDIFDDKTRRLLREQLLQSMAEEDPLGTIQLLADKGWETTNQAALQLAITTVAEDNPENAMALLADLPPGNRASLEIALINAVAKNDIDRALAMAQSPVYGSKDMILLRVIKTIGEKDMARSLSLIDAMAGTWQRQNAMRSLLQAASPNDMPLLAKKAEQMGNNAWGINSINPVATAWAREDPVGALNWAQSLPKAQRSQAVSKVISQIAAAEPLRAVDIVNGLSGQGGDEARRQLASTLARQQMADEALALAGGASTPEARQAIQLSALGQMARNDPDQALVLAAQTGDATLRDAVLMTVINSASRQDPQQAFERLDEISDPAVRRQTERRVVSQLLDTLPPGDRFDSTSAALATSSKIDIDEALRLASGIGGDRARESTYAAIIFMAARQDPAKGRELLERVDLPDQMRERLEIALLQANAR